MKKVELTRGKVALVDDADYDYVKQFNWWAHETEGGRWYAYRHISYEESPFNVTMHRDLLDPPPDKQIDHINHDGLDNRRENLRIVDQATNQQSRRGPNKNNAIGLIGVSPHGASWRVQLMNDGVRYRIGSWSDPHVAALVYDLWSTDLRGEHGSTNFEVVSYG